MNNSIRSLLRKPRAVIMGIVNVTPDSFSDGGQFDDTDKAVRHAISLVNAGADILDIGGESTRPGAEPVSEQQELDRVIPVIEKLSQAIATAISIDTSKPQVMKAALQAGADMVNDVYALQQPGAIDVVAKQQVPVCLMHRQGDPKTMQAKPQYQDVVQQVIDFLCLRIDACVECGVSRQDIIVDPGIGFGKTLAHNLTLLANNQTLTEQLACPLLIGVSRKSMIAELLDRKVEQRVSASVGLAVQAVLNGARIVRVHDVAQSHDAIRCVEAVLQSSKMKEQ